MAETACPRMGPGPPLSQACVSGWTVPVATIAKCLFRFLLRWEQPAMQPTPDFLFLPYRSRLLHRFPINLAVSFLHSDRKS